MELTDAYWYFAASNLIKAVVIYLPIHLQINTCIIVWKYLALLYPFGSKQLYVSNSPMAGKI